MYKVTVIFENETTKRTFTLPMVSEEVEIETDFYEPHMPPIKGLFFKLYPYCLQTGEYMTEIVETK